MKTFLDSRHPVELLSGMSDACDADCVLCRWLGVLMLQSTVLRILCEQEGRGVLVLSARLVVPFRNAEALRLLGKWFPGDAERLPAELLAGAQALWARREVGHEARTLEREGETLVLELWPMPGFSGAHSCLISLREVRPPSGAPEGWRGRLSPRQFEIASLVLSGASNDVIAAHFRTTLGTVKKQVSTIFDRLGVNSRSQLGALASRHR